ncbi:MAG TPA: prolyl oligopeptidase family serine peptidase [Candidatus Acidoferrales bacterium]|nr:prolyl oligopeptidase family serine peptidase [Candidatus Acidoferrales bacterium]
MKYAWGRLRWFALILSAPLAWAAAAPAARAQQAAGDRSWTPGDVIYEENAAGFRVSPDGRQTVWVKSAMDRATDRRASNLMLSSPIDNREIQLTRGADNVSAPRWSPDARLIAFLFTRKLPDAKPNEAQRQIWLIDAAGGEPWPLTRLTRSVNEFKWVDSHAIVYSAEEDPTLYEQEARQRKDDSNAVEDAPHTPPVRLFRVTVPDGKVSRLTANADWIRNFAVSPDGRRAVTVNQQELAYAWDQKTLPKTFLVDLSTGEEKPIFTEGRIAPTQIHWAPDGSGVYAIAPYSDSPRFLTASIELVYFYELSTGEVHSVDLHWANGLGRGFQATAEGFLALLADGVRFRPARYVREAGGWRQEFLTGEQAKNIFGFDLCRDGRTLVYEYSTASTPPQWYRATLSGSAIDSPAAFTHLNPTYKSKIISKTEVVQWKGANDDTVDGVLYYPHDYRPGHRYPLLLMIHGGPTGFDTDSWSQSWAYPVQLYTERGAFALRVNYHGSGNHGLAWASSICCGKYYTLEVPNIEKGVDALIGRGLVDPERVATMGWSNGAILSIALAIDDPGRYKALSEGAGDSEWVSDWANVDFGESFDHYYFGASPIENPQLYIDKSPFFKIARLQAPTIMFQGTNDRNVPTDQGWDLYRAIYWTDKVPYRFVLFPGEPHGPLKASHQLRKVNEEAAWFDKYFFHAPAPPSEALKSGSPLDVLVASSRVGAVYGVAHQPAGSADPVLIPEIVRHGGIEIGRFEITRAQFAAFDPGYKIPEGTGNFPANSISFEQAEAYCAWLSKLTGETYRLPSEAEGARLYGSSANQNTLDYWAGYAVNPDDARRLEPFLAKLPPGALLKPVGSFPGAGAPGEPLVFDLGGNVAEWVVGAGGAGETLGSGADQPSDPKARRRPADPAYTGFRVVREGTR